MESILFFVFYLKKKKISFYFIVKNLTKIKINNISFCIFIKKKLQKIKIKKKLFQTILDGKYFFFLYFIVKKNNKK